MKKPNTLIISSVLILVVVVLAMFIIILMSYSMLENDEEKLDISMKRYFAICTNPQLDGWQDIKIGLQNAADEHNSAIEFLETGFEDERADASCIEMAVDSGADGIIVYASDRDVDLEIDYAAENLVPVVFIVNDYDHDKIFKLRSDPLLFASKMVDYVKGMDQPNKNIAIISSEQFESNKSEPFLSLFKLQGFDVTVKPFSGPHVFDANETVKELISSQDGIGMICCLDATATLGVAQSIVELNKVSVITIIGSGKTEEILNMIQKGIITATIAVDYEKIGSEAIRVLSESGRPIRYEKRILSDIYVIDKSNVRRFMEVTAE